MTYYGPRPPAIDPRSIRRVRDQQVAFNDVRQIVGDQLPDGYAWAHRPPLLTLIHGGDPTVPGQDEILARAALIRAIVEKGAAA